MEIEEVKKLKEYFKTYPHKNWMSREEWIEFQDNYYLYSSSYKDNGTEFIDFLIEYKNFSFSDFIASAFIFSHTDNTMKWYIISKREYPLK